MPIQVNLKDLDPDLTPFFYKIDTSYNMSTNTSQKLEKRYPEKTSVKKKHLSKYILQNAKP